MESKKCIGYVVSEVAQGGCRIFESNDLRICKVADPCGRHVGLRRCCEIKAVESSWWCEHENGGESLMTLCGSFGICLIPLTWWAYHNDG